MRRLPDNVGQLSQPLLQPFMITPQNQMYGIPQNNMPQPAYMIPPQQLEQQQQQQTPQVPMAQQQQQLQMQLQWPQAYGMVQQQPMGEASANLVMPQFYTNGNSIATNPSMGQQESPSLQQPLRPRQESLGVQPDALPMNNIQPPVQQQQLTNTMPPPKEAEPAVFVMQEQPMGAAPISNGNPRPSLNNNPMPRADVTVLYYDPKQTIAGPNGQVRLPTIVYDAQGNPVDLVSLVAQNQAQILLEPPMRQAEEAPARLLVQEQEMPAAQLLTPDIKRWGESTAQDQSIIVSTVAVMALLVGALSARRMRNRSVLSSCIENESLEDDVAYDAAYSTTLPQTEGSSYNTFGGGWKGDLEKFDV